MRIAIQGEKGSFHHAAAELYFNQSVSLLPCESFRDVFQSLEKQRVDTGIAAIENSLYGSIHETYDMLVRHDFAIVGEIMLPIHQQLIVNPGTDIKNIAEIYSHPAALDQCRNYLETHFPTTELIEHHDTAAAVDFIKQKQFTNAAAIASSNAAKLHDMEILATNIEDNPDNFTRFVVIKRDSEAVARPTKASLILTTNHEPGALYNALGVFKQHDANLTKLESRPVRGEAFRYQFIVDVLADDGALKAITAKLQTQNCHIKTLGNYQASS